MASTISYVYREQLSNLMKTLNSTTPHFIRCIVPNYNRIPFVFEGPLVLHQLRYSFLEYYKVINHNALVQL